MKQRKLYDEESELPHPWEWVIIILFSASIVGFGLLVFVIVAEGPRFWDVGQLPDTPAESIYSTENPRGSAVVPLQLHKLPESRSDTLPKPPHEQLRERGPKR